MSSTELISGCLTNEQVVCLLSILASKQLNSEKNEPLNKTIQQRRLYKTYVNTGRIKNPSQEKLQKWQIVWNTSIGKFDFIEKVPENFRGTRPVGTVCVPRTYTFHHVK